MLNIMVYYTGNKTSIVCFDFLKTHPRGKDKFNFPSFAFTGTIIAINFGVYLVEIFLFYFVRVKPRCF